MMVGNIHPETIKRFMEKVEFEPNTGCWLWSGSHDKDGYGVFRYDGSNRAHRASFRLFKGPILKGLMILHSCDTPSCVNPEHLRQGDAFDNMRDMVKKGRGKEQKKTHCPHGHEYTKNNILIRRRKGKAIGRECKICTYSRNNSRYHLKRDKLLGKQRIRRRSSKSC